MSTNTSPAERGTARRNARRIDVDRRRAYRTTDLYAAAEEARKAADEVRRQLKDEHCAHPDTVAIGQTGEARVSITVAALRTLGVVW